MSSRSLSAESITASCTGMVQRPHGGTVSKLIRCRWPRLWGHTRFDGKTGAAAKDAGHPRPDHPGIPMTSFRQIEANRRNALKSTGPTTEEVKHRSRQNAMRRMRDDEPPGRRRKLLLYLGPSNPDFPAKQARPYFSNASCPCSAVTSRSGPIYFLGNRRGFLSLTPGPPPFSSMNSTPAASGARRPVKATRLPRVEQGAWQGRKEQNCIDKCLYNLQIIFLAGKHGIRGF